MQIRLIVVGLTVILLGILRHFAPGISKKRAILPGYLITGIGVLMVIAGILLE
jgi:hypothetical protein